MRKLSQLGAASIAFLVSVVLFIATLGVTGIAIPFLKSNDAIYILLAFATIVPLGLGFLLYMLLSKQSFKSFWGDKVSIEQLALSAFLAPFSYMVIILVQTLWITLLSALGLPPLPDTLPPINNGVTLVLGLISVAVIPGIFEEIIFRGMLQRSLVTRRRSNIAILLTATLFMLMHGAIQSIPYTFLLGLLLGYLCLRSGSVWPAIVFHFSNNAIAVFTKFMASFQETMPNAEAILGNADWIQWVSLSVTGLIGGAMTFLFLFVFDKISPKRRTPIQKDYRPLRIVEWLPLLLGALALLGLMFFSTIASLLMPSM